jgi:hypothetical protein
MGAWKWIPVGLLTLLILAAAFEAPHLKIPPLPNSDLSANLSPNSKTDYVLPPQSEATAFAGYLAGPNATLRDGCPAKLIFVDLRRVWTRFLVCTELAGTRGT